MDALAILVLAHLMDLAYPFHSGIMLKLHPTHTAYVLARRLGKPYSSKLRGLGVWLLVTTVHMTVASLLLYVTWHVSYVVWLILSAYMLKTCIPLRLLVETVWKAYREASRGDTYSLRNTVQSLVRRNVWKLDQPRVHSAAIESLAENLVDAYISPLLYYSLLGPLGAIFQRVVNSLDAALGYRSHGFAEIGWFSAKADTVVNYIPARLASILVALVVPRQAYRVIHCVLENAKRTPSVNAGYPISAFAGALEVQLEKPNSYTIICGPRLPSASDMKKAVSLAIRLTAAQLALTISIMLVVLAH
jgi:adenosylcobinamide-phosphate synthase